MSQNISGIKSSCHLWPDMPHRCSTLSKLRLLSTWLSLIGCLFVIALIYTLRKHKIMIQKLILSLSAAGALESITHMIGDDFFDKPTLCKIHGFFVQFSVSATLLWVVVITINCLFIIRGKEYKKYFLIYHVFVWGTALIWSLIPWIDNWYGPAHFWCWINEDKKYARIGMWFIPLYTSCFILLLVYIYIVLYVWKATKPNAGQNFSSEESQATRRRRNELKPLLSYPLIYILFTIPIFIHRIHNIQNPNDEPVYVLAILTVLLTPALGFLNALAFAIFNASIQELSYAKLKFGILQWVHRKPKYRMSEPFALPDMSSSQVFTVS